MVISRLESTKCSLPNCCCHLQGKDSGNKMTSAAPVTEKPVKEEWAIMVDVTEPVKDFHKRVPDMAHKVRN